MRRVLCCWVAVLFLAPAFSVAQTNDGNTYPWCPPQVNRLYAMYKDGHPLATNVKTQTVGNNKQQFAVVDWPIPPFPEAPQPKTLLRYRVLDGSYYWWFDDRWTRVAAEPAVLERSGIIYGIGTVEDVSRGVALIDVGDVHTLKPVAPFSQVAVFRLTQSRYSPIGVLSIAETYATYSRTKRSVTVSPEPGDVVMFVRELSQMKSVNEHRDAFLRRQLLKTSTSSSFSNYRRYEIAKALRGYEQNYRRWETSKARVVGFLNGESFEKGGEREVQDLLNWVDVIREDFREGRNSLPAAGPAWHSTMQVLMGPTAHSQHQAAQVAAGDNEFGREAEGPTPGDIRRAVRLRFFDNTPEQQNVLSYLIATIIEASPASPEVWLRQRLLQSQFPQMADEEAIQDKVRLVVQELTEI